MKKKLAAALCLAALTGGIALGQPAGTPGAAAILAAVEAALAPDDYRMLVHMVTSASRGEDRLLSLEVYFKRGLGSFMEIHAPARSKGIRFLELDQGLWMYNPRGGGRAVRLSPRESFQGTVFSNADLSDARFTADYEATLAGVEAYEHPELGRIRAYRIIAAAKSAASAYGRVEFTVATEGLVPLAIDYYAKSGLLFKTMRLDRIQAMAGMVRPTRMVMESRIDPGARTVVTIEEMELRDNPPSLFTQGNLTR